MHAKCNYHCGKREGYEWLKHSPFVFTAFKHYEDTIQLLNSLDKIMAYAYFERARCLNIFLTSLDCLIVPRF